MISAVAFKFHHYWYTEFALLREHYHTIIELMPENYQETAQALINFISDDQICSILCCSNSTTANKMILDCLIEKMSRREELFNLCDQLQRISTSQQLKAVISEIRSSECFIPLKYVTYYVTLTKQLS